MLERFSDWLREQPRSRVEQKQLMAGYVEAFPEFRSDGHLRTRVREALDILAQKDVLRLPAGKSGWDAYGSPKLPLWVSVVREKTVRRDFDSVNWIPELSFAPGVLRTSQLGKLQVLNQFLIDNRGKLTTTVPFRERALEIFGDEKAFEGVVKGDMLFGRIPLSVLAACNPEPPLAREDFDSAQGPLLLLENHHTYWSMLQWNRKILRYRSVGYGSGNTILKSARAIGDALERSGAPYAEYFGDLDPSGVSIGATLDKALQAEGLPALRPATPFYRWMLGSGLRRALGDGKRLEVGSALEWLPEGLREHTDQLFQSGQWIPQESLSLHVLHCEEWAV
jgi:hypothetical protein